MTLPLLYLRDISLSFGNKALFENVSLQILAGDRICLVGKNGCGKTTLMSIITGHQEFDQGELYTAKGLTIGYLAQKLNVDNNATIYEYVMAGLPVNDHDSLENKRYLADIVLEALNLNGNKTLGTISGGKLRRAALARALIGEPQLLLLDEPTNHLDIDSIKWLERYLCNFKGGILCISHDREFLNNISNKTCWLKSGGLLTNNKGFKDFDEWSEQILDQEERELSKLGQKLAEENIWLQQGVTARRKRNQGRLRKLFELRTKLKTEKNNFLRAGSNIKLPSLPGYIASKLVVEMSEVSHAFFDVEPPQPTIKNFSMRIIKGERIGIMGRNGAGKTTFLRLLTGELQPTSGSIRLGPKVTISYFDQKRATLDPNKTLWETLCPEGGDTVSVSGTYKHVVAYLKDFLFDSKQVKSPVSSLSGGEASRLLLARTLLNPGSLLILDEPTNDLDMDTLDILHEMLSEYKGTLIIVSHDRDFLNRLVTRTLIFQPDASIVDYIGGYSDYLEEASKIKEKSSKDNNKTKPKPEVLDKVIDHKPTKLSYKYQRELELLPEKIAKLENEIKELEQQITDPNLYQHNPDQFLQTANILQGKKQELATAELRWLELEEMRESYQGN